MGNTTAATFQWGTAMTTAPEVSSLGCVLGLWAHPDDEAYLSAGLMAQARAHGNRVVVATATLGERGTDDPTRWPPERLEKQRRIELAESLEVIDVHEHRLFGYPDGGLADVPLAEGVARVAALLDEVRPDTVVTFGPDGMTGHPDHRTISTWTTQAWLAAGGSTRLWYAATTAAYHRKWGELNDRIGVWSMAGPPPIAREDQLAFVLTCDEEMLDRKLAALRAHHTQTANLITMMGEEQYRQWWGEEAFTDAARVLDSLSPAT